MHSTFNILITGGAGFIGSHTAEALIKQGHTVVVVDELNDYYDTSIKIDNIKLLQELSLSLGSSFVFYKADICDKLKMDEIMSAHRIDAIIHLAARAGVRASIQEPELYVHSNVLGSTVVFELAGKHKVKHVVYASSSSVYGGNKKVPFSETDMIDDQQSPYAATKKATEALASAYSNLYKVPMTGLRFFTVYGPRGRPDMAPFKFVDRVLRGQTIDQYGDGSSSRDYTYVSDIVDGILRALERPKGHRVFNLGNSSPVSLKEFIGLIELVTGKKAKIRVLGMQPGDVDRTCADIEYAKRELGYEPRTSLAEGLSHLAKWWRSKFEYHEETTVLVTESWPVAKKTESVKA